ncbi:MAG: hypothetical protein HWE25_09265 [Alphaproteobacteria bacterium]|nr:hypothetical protein [Alphaproteobacteria bacterium]
MPEITIFGWFHTIIGIAALLSGVYSLVKFRIIRFADTTGKTYLFCTLLAAASALGLYNATGEFNKAHILAILTLGALAVGRIAETTQLFRQFSSYIQATSYTATFLFHMIPAITDGLMRLPVSDPIVKSVEDPLLKQFYLAFLIGYLVLLASQLLWLRKQKEAA